MREYRGAEPAAHQAGMELAQQGTIRITGLDGLAEVRMMALARYPGATLEATRLRKAFLDGFRWGSLPNTG